MRKLNYKKIVLAILLVVLFISVPAITSDASWRLRGNTSGSRPLIGNPSASSMSTTLQANNENRFNVLTVRVSLSVNNNGTGTATTGWVTQNNTSRAATGTLRASTRSAAFTGTHEARNVAGGAWTRVTTSIAW